MQSIGFIPEVIKTKRRNLDTLGRHFANPDGLTESERPLKFVPCIPHNKFPPFQRPGKGGKLEWYTAYRYPKGAPNGVGGRFAKKMTLAEKQKILGLSARP